MNIRFNNTLLMVMLAALCVSPSSWADRLQLTAKALLGTLPSAMPNAKDDTHEMIALGKALYMDERLSVNNSQSCNTCHNVIDNGPGVDNTQFSPGALAGEFGTRNAPTVWNAGFQFVQFWDGRANDLTAQAKLPILNSAEMGMPSEQAVVDKLANIPEYRQAFKQAFKKENALTYDNLAHAIASFERTLITHDRFDLYLNGQLDAMNAQEKSGLKAFLQNGCAACHNGPLLGGNMYQKMGLINAYKNQADQGVFDVTKNVADKMMFKVPMLRDVARTAPYFHDGSVANLTQAVQQMAKLQLGKEIDDKTVADIVVFLKALNHQP